MSVSPQIIRIVRILSLFSSLRKYSSAELIDKLNSQEDEKSVSIRQIQRDLLAIMSAGIPLQIDKEGSARFYSLPREYRNIVPTTFEENEVLSLYILKDLMSSLKNSRLQQDINKLIAKLESAVPGKLYLEQQLSTDISPGRYVNSIPDDIISKIVHAITDPQWDRVTYRSIAASSTKTYVVSFCRLINHFGRLYVIAWHPKHNSYLTLAADAIEDVHTVSDHPLPLHTFSEQDYIQQRFGVYGGSVEEIILKISPGAVNFFTKRLWHPTQEFIPKSKGYVLLRMFAPVTPELLSWIMGWAHELQVLKPLRLKNECKVRAEAVASW